MLIVLVVLLLLYVKLNRKCFVTEIWCFERYMKTCIQGWRQGNLNCGVCAKFFRLKGSKCRQKKMTPVARNKYIRGD